MELIGKYVYLTGDYYRWLDDKIVQCVGKHGVYSGLFRIGSRSYVFYLKYGKENQRAFLLSRLEFFMLKGK